MPANILSLRFIRFIEHYKAGHDIKAAAGLAQSVERETLMRFISRLRVRPPRSALTLAGLAQSVERETLNLKAAGSTPAFGFFLLLYRVIWHVVVDLSFCRLYGVVVVVVVVGGCCLPAYMDGVSVCIQGSLSADHRQPTTDG
ncbi:hypothetical protein ASPWEDRAFT_42319 [Aspergillus wentii DTO 134E9]|uniref:Uncharacterized protein n=1 Tax=Aspergillus wentii DTO 134E9 TaxID=1073089 RepID=A0A1L9RHN1_ASPWE|nr:uncharacterized protein ASPWEDRAFT_42319 [Aspergillus wentii DTO 134E9]OJJ34343.1 hypothetical protein ASPWEDRAFT_42319 [Aspergillus wentii DTO 134E9]